MAGRNTTAWYLFQRAVLEVDCRDLYAGNPADAGSVIGRGSLCGQRRRQDRNVHRRLVGPD